MQTIYLQEPYNKKQIPNEAIVLAMGFFDGVHCGHRKVIEIAKKEAQKLGVKLAVLTFDRYPGLVYRKTSPDFKYLTTLKTKLRYFADLGVDITYVVAFNEQLVPMDPQTFIDKYVVDLHAKCLVAGSDFTYGKREIANMQTLPQYAKERFTIIEVPHLEDQVGKISSTRIRNLLAKGQVAAANELLGADYSNTGLVIHGQKMGRKLGYPTINVDVDAAERIPGEGVYAVRVRFVGETKEYYGMASIGKNETVGDNLPVTVEVHLLNFQADVYGREVVILWDEYLRSMEKFSSLEQLMQQLAADQLATEKYYHINNN
ncbi:riboflavin biosynthesis protein RibF [Ligilactobacillus ceti]|uniref:Riboflavin biosynthesis protein n=1 Tax=Ligilactobacillus ceti DSM 22408 TaxID=1122146 RepID=A0A0R2KMF0_9LACO|nr:riboflavin biosynthesis protein RibF [Ligilactobacillus ceti]KRN88629.1 riboflavin kinase fmn adenylyltransferase [Ligilactobacillus ceti DSM 22408]